MKPSSLAGLVALLPLALALGGCPLGYIDLDRPEQAAGASSGAGGAGGTGGGPGGAGSLCAPASIASCYDGPPGTEGVGLCKAGSKTCNAEGTDYGPCSGENTPTPEDCATATDEDCDGLSQSCKGIPVWSKRAGNADNQYGQSVAADGAGNVLVTGYFNGALDLEGCPLSLSSVGETDLFVAKLDPFGACLWSKKAGDGGSQYGQSVAADSAGNVLVAGLFSSSMSLTGCAPLSSVTTGGTDLFVAKLDPSGMCLWSKSADDGKGGSLGQSVALDGAGNVLMTGVFTGSMGLAGCPLSSAGGGTDLFVAKLDPSGTCLWSKGVSASASDAYSQYGQSVAVDGAGNVLVTGTFSGTVNLPGCAPLSSVVGGLELFVAKLDPSGTCLWRKGAGTGGSNAYTEYGQSVAVDGAGNVLVTGTFSGKMNLGGCPLLSSAGGGVDLFVAKLDPSGTCMWSKNTGDAANLQYGTSIAADHVGNVLVTGSFMGALNFGGGSLGSVGANDFFIVKLDAAGAHQWSQRAGGPGDDGANGVAVDHEGNVLVTGAFKGVADFAPDPLVSKGGTDVFVVKFAP